MRFVSEVPPKRPGFDLRQIRVRLIIIIIIIIEEADSCALVGCEEMTLLCKSNTTRPVLYIISGLLVHFCTTDDEHNDARNMLS
jgi:hypothetical protein